MVVLVVVPALGKSQRSKPNVSRAYHPLRAVVPVKVYLNASARCDEAFPNTTFRATEMAGGPERTILPTSAPSCEIRTHAHNWNSQYMYSEQQR
jgi:hypothetical protein